MAPRATHTLSVLAWGRRSLRAYAPTLRISKRSFAGTTSEPRKSDTARAVCKSNPEHGVRLRATLPPSASHPGVPAATTRACARCSCAHLFNVQKAGRMHPGEVFPLYRFGRPGPIAGSRFYRAARLVRTERA